MTTLDALLDAYDVAMAARNPAEGWHIKRYPNHFVLACAGPHGALEIKHELGTSDAVELASIAKVGNGRALLFGTRLIGPLRAALNPESSICLRGTYRGDWGENGPEASAASVIDALARVTRETPFESEAFDSPPSEVRVAGALSGIPRTEIEASPESLSSWLDALKVHHIRTTQNEWHIQTARRSGVGYTFKLNLFGQTLIALSYGAPNGALVVDEALVQSILRENYASGLAKQTLVVFSDSGKEAPVAAIEWPAAAVQNARSLGFLLDGMTEYLDRLWDRLRIFFC